VTAVLDALVIGAGAVGSGYDESRRGDAPLTHAGAYDCHPATRLVGAVDPEPLARERFTARWGVPAHGDLDAALSAGVPAVVSLCTPAAGRVVLVEQLLDAGVRAIWCEKPMAAGTTEGTLIVAACAHANVALQVNFLRRFDPLHARVASRVRKLGGVEQLDVRYGGPLRGYGTHGVDLFRWFAGEVAWVDAVAVEGREPLVVLGTATGAIGVLAHVPARAAELFEVDVLSGGERLMLGGLGEQLVVATAGPSALFDGVTRLDYGGARDASGVAQAMMGGVQALVDHLRDGTPLPCSGADGVAALAVHDAVEAALAAHGRVVPTVAA
jgi:predicted dehydrogenase